MADKTSPCCWSQLPTDILESILKRLSFIDVIRFKAVSSSWYSAAQAISSSSSSSYYSTTGAFHQTPCLMFPPSTHQQKVTNITHNYFRFFNLEDDRLYELKDMPKEKIGHQFPRFVGSSHGWLIHLDETVSPNLLNPFSPTPIQLPSLKTVSGSGVKFCKVKFCELVDGEYTTVAQETKEYSSGVICEHYWHCKSMADLQNCFISRAILSSDPFHSNNYRVIVIYLYSSKLAFYNCGDSTWTNLDGKHESCSDIIFYNHHLYAVDDEMGSVEVWDFRDSNFPTKTMDIDGPSYYQSKTVNFGENSLRDKYTTIFYLVESSGDLLLVMRIINGKNSVLGDLDFPLKTLVFDVYKMDFDLEKWVEVESLGDRVLFVGRNHSLSLSARDVPAGCKENSIYFTEDYLYGGHDTGVFNLEDRSIEPFYQCESCDSWKNIECSPFWVFPNPW